MVVQRAIKTYPMIKWFVALAVVALVVGVVMSNILTGSGGDDNLVVLFIAVGVAIVLPFLAMAFPRRQVLTMELPTDKLAGRSKGELEAILAGLDDAKAKGEMDDARYNNAKARVVAAMKAQK